LRIAKVHWIDASYYDEGENTESFELFDALAVGIVLEDDDAKISLAMEQFQTGDLRRILVIPKGMVQDVETIWDDGDQDYSFLAVDPNAIVRDLVPGTIIATDGLGRPIPHDRISGENITVD